MEKDNPVTDYLNYVKKKKCGSVFWHIIIVLLCLAGVYLITRAIVCDCENVTQNIFALVLMYMLWLLLIIMAMVFTCLIIRSNSRYNMAINRLELLKTRLKVNESMQNIIADVDRELQLIARILETQTIIR